MVISEREKFDALKSQENEVTVSSVSLLQPRFALLMGNPNAPIFDVKELLEPLNIMHDSLVYGGYSDVADGLLVDIIRLLVM